VAGFFPIGAKANQPLIDQPTLLVRASV